MRTFAQAIKETPRETLTENGMVTLDHSGDNLTTLFFTIGSSRGKDLSIPFARAYAQDPTLAMKMLFWVRDIRGGAGERGTFRALLKDIEQKYPESLERNLHLVPEYGRWDDLLVFATPKMKEKAYALIGYALNDRNGLCAKWMPRKGLLAKELRTFLNLTPKRYRKILVALTKVVETQMCAQEWSEINYDHVPSVASARYQKAFNKRDAVRYTSWKAGLKTGESKVNAQALYPYDVIKSVSHGDKDTALAQWEALPNYLGDDKILPVCDVSGSMTCQVGGQKGVGLSCLDVCVSLGLYIADKQQGAFKDCFLTFSSNSKLEVLKGNLLQKMHQLQRSEWGMSTSLESAYDEILRVAVKNKLPQSEMPKYLLVFSDMQFNHACNEGRSVGAFDLARSKFAKAGYQLPKIVWWQLNARSSDGSGNVPVKFDENGTALVSGFSPAIMKSILAAKNFTPRDIMLDTLMSDRYEKVVG